MRFWYTCIIGFSILSIALAGCDANHEGKVINENGISYLESDDPEMQAAIEESRKTFPEFIAAYETKDSSFQDFAIKMPFKAGDRSEHIWLNDIQLKNGKIFGVVNNDPETTDAVKFGDTLEIDTSSISDWNYIRENKLYGGYSIRLLRNRMSPKERAEFDSSYGLIIE